MGSLLEEAVWGMLDIYMDSFTSFIRFQFATKCIDNYEADMWAQVRLL